MFSLPIVVRVEDSSRAWEFEYDGSHALSIGRSPECDIILDTDKASRNHAEVLGEGGRFTVIDSGSANGTRVNGEKIRRHDLEPGDVITIGRAHIAFGDAAPVAAPVAPLEKVTPPPVAVSTTPPAAVRIRRPSPFVAILNVVVPILLLGGLGLLIWKFLGDPVPTPDRTQAGTATGSAGTPISPGPGSTGVEPRPADSIPTPGVVPPAVPPGESHGESSVGPGFLTAQADLDDLLRDAGQGLVGWEVVERLELFAESNTGTPAAAQARRWAPVLAGLRKAARSQETDAARSAVQKLLDEERFAEALVAARFLSTRADDGKVRAEWKTRQGDIEDRARSSLHVLERDLGDLVRAGRADEALRALVNQREKYAGTEAYEALLPQFVEAGIAGRPTESRAPTDGAEVLQLEEMAARAFGECRFQDLAPIYYRILGVDPPPETRIRALEGLVDAFYLNRMFEDFLGQVSGQPVEVSLSEGYRGRVVRADAKEVEHEVDLGEHTYRDTEPWEKISSVKKVALFSSVKLGRDGLLGLVVFCFHHGFEEGAQKALVRLHKRKDSRDLAAAVLARHRQIAIPESGFVEYRGRLVSPEERDLAIASRQRAKEEEKARMRELKEAKLTGKLSIFIDHARRLRTEGRYELAHKILMEVGHSPRFKDSPAAAEARRVADDPILAHGELVTSGPSKNRMDIAVLGDGFPIDDDAQAQFLVYANTAKRLLLSEEPYREYQSYLNFYTVNLGSRDEGLSTGADRGDVAKDTPLGGRVEWSVITFDRGKVLDILERTPRETDRVSINIGNDFADVATGGGGMANLSKAGLTPVGHELGHGLGGLHDEYDSPAGNDPDRPIVKKRKTGVPTNQRPPNLMEGSDREHVLAHTCWQEWIDAGEEKWWNGAPVGVFEGGGYTPFNVWRPQANCKMRTASVNFCVVCMEVMVKAIYRYARPIDKVEPEGEEIVIEDGRQLVVKVWPMKPETHFLEAKWTLLDLGVDPQPEDDGPTKVDDKRPGELYRRVGRIFDADGRVVEVAQIRSRDLRGGRYRLRVEVRDPTPWVLNDLEGRLRQTREWIITIK